MFIDKKKHKDGVTVTVKLACAKDIDIVAAVEYNETFCEIDQSAYQVRHPSKYYINLFLQTYQLKCSALRISVKYCQTVKYCFNINTFFSF